MTDLHNLSTNWIVVEANPNDAAEPLVRAAFSRKEEANDFAASCVTVMGNNVKKPYAAVIDRMGGQRAIRSAAIKLVEMEIDYLTRWIEAARSAHGAEDIAVTNGQDNLTAARAKLAHLTA